MTQSVRSALCNKTRQSITGNFPQVSSCKIYKRKKKKINSTVTQKIIHNHQIYFIPFFKDGVLFQISTSVFFHINTSEKSILNKKKKIEMIRFLFVRAEK